MTFTSAVVNNMRKKLSSRILEDTLDVSSPLHQRAGMLDKVPRQKTRRDALRRDDLLGLFRLPLPSAVCSTEYRLRTHIGIQFTECFFAHCCCTHAVLRRYSKPRSTAYVSAQYCSGSIARQLLNKFDTIAISLVSHFVRLTRKIQRSSEAQSKLSILVSTPPINPGGSQGSDKGLGAV